MPAFEEYVEAIRPLWDSHWLTNMGCFHRELESQLKDYLDVQEVSLVVNGHMALELAIQAFEFPSNAEIITTPFTFISTTHAIVRNGLKPVFCDVKVSDGTMDDKKIEGLISDKTVAIIPVHVYGNVCNVDAIQRIADKYGLKVIYDAAHAFGVKYKDKGIGGYGDAAVFSFHATKVFNTIEGGAVTFSAHEMYEKLYNLKNFGIRGEEIVSDIGANAKMNEFAAIMGLCNLRHISEAIEKRERLCAYYLEELSNVRGIRVFDSKKAVERNYAYFPIIVEKEYNMSRNGLYDWLRENNIFARKYFYPLTSDQECYKNKFKDNKLECAKELAEKVLVLPLYPELKREDIKRISDLIKIKGKV